jgi:nucleoside-diphosphate-sugar epimerase
LILRPAVVYGAGNGANMLSLMDAIYRRRFFLIGTSENIKSLISVRNLVAAVDHLLTLSFSGTHLFYLTDKENYSVAQIARMILDILKRKDSLRSVPIPFAKSAALLGDAFVRLTGKDFPLTSNRLKALCENTNFSCAKLRETGFVHPQTTRQGLEEMVNWYLSDGKLKVRS